MDSTATSGGQPWAGGDEWEEVCPPASARLVGGRRKQIKTTRVNGWFALRLKAFVTNQPLKGL